MIKIQELEDILNQLFNGQEAVDYCPNGLQVEGKKEIRKVATAVSADLKTIETAVNQEVNALIVHHGLFWFKDSFVIQGTKRQKLSLLLENQISLFAYHLPLDRHSLLGNNWKAALEMGWTNLQPFCWYQGAPIGVKGEVTKCSSEEFKKQLEQYYQHSAVFVPGGQEKIERVGLVSGGAYKSIVDAAREGLDAFITGSFDEPAWYQAFEEKINFFALGHSATEKIGPRALAEYLDRELKVPCHFLDNANPF